MARATSSVTSLGSWSTCREGVPLTPIRRKQLASAKKIMERDANILKALAQ